MIPKANTTLRAVERSIRLKPTYARRPPVARWTMSSTMSTLRMPSHTLSPSTNPTRPTRMSTTPKIWANRLTSMRRNPPAYLLVCCQEVYAWARLADDKNSLGLFTRLLTRRILHGGLHSRSAAHLTQLYSPECLQRFSV